MSFTLLSSVRIVTFSSPMVLGPFPTTVSGSLERKINRVRVKKPSRRRANVCNDLYDRRKLLAWHRHGRYRVQEDYGLA